MSNLNYYELDPENNHFYSIFVDVTHRCNMECANCYTPTRTVPDLDIDKFYSVLNRLPSKTEIRLIGGEPTLRTDLFDIVKNIRSRGHRPTMMTNGLILAREGYAERLVESGMRSIYISMNGADNNNLYRIMDNGDWAERKVKALHSCISNNMNVNIGAILQKNINNNVPSRLREIVGENPKNIIFRFRNVGQVGRYSLNKSQNWSWQEMVNLVCKQFNVDPEWANKYHKINGYEEKNTLFFPLEQHGKKAISWVKITDWSPEGSDLPDPGNLRRGRLTQDFKIAPFFEHIKKYENQY